jgi:hypothetical protein
LRSQVISLPEFSKRYHLRSLTRMKKIGTPTIPLRVPDKCEHLIVGYTTHKHLMLDLDHAVSLNKALRLIRMIQTDFPYVGDCLLCRSSEEKYHAIFDSLVHWCQVIHVTETLAGLGILNRYYMIVRHFRKDLTLRVSSVDRGYKKSAAPLPVAFIPVPGFIFTAYKYDRYPLTTFSCNIAAERSDETFSGIRDYLLMLSVFRPLSSLEVPIL